MQTNTGKRVWSIKKVAEKANNKIKWNAWLCLYKKWMSATERWSLNSSQRSNLVQYRSNAPIIDDVHNYLFRVTSHNPKKKYTASIPGFADIPLATIKSFLRKVPYIYIYNHVEYNWSKGNRKNSEAVLLFTYFVLLHSVLQRRNMDMSVTYRAQLKNNMNKTCRNSYINHGIIYKKKI